MTNKDLLKMVFCIILFVCVHVVYLAIRNYVYYESTTIPKEVCYTWFSMHSENVATTVSATNTQSLIKMRRMRTDKPLVHDCTLDIWKEYKYKGAVHE